MIYYIGIDNGVSGSIAIIDEKGNLITYQPTPVFKSLNYTKEKKYSMRLDVQAFMDIIEPYHTNAHVFLERPMINPLRWSARISAIRCDEATRILLEGMKVRFEYIDSKAWQSVILPKRKAVARLPKGSSAEDKKKLKAAKAAFALETKSLSKEVGYKLFPQADIKKDADALLIAEWARRQLL